MKYSLARIKRLRADVVVVVVLLALVVVFYNKITVSSLILVGYDIFTYFYPHQGFAADALSRLHLPLWNPYLFTGVPFLANMQTGVFYPFNLLFLAFSVPHAFAYSVALHVFLGGFFTYLFCRISLRLGAAAAFVSANVFAFSGFISSLVGHLNQLQAAIWLPLLLLLFHLSYRRHSVRWAILAGLVLALQFTAGHAQESYLTLAAVGMFLAFHVARIVLAPTGVCECNRLLGSIGRATASRPYPGDGRATGSRPYLADGRATGSRPYLANRSPDVIAAPSTSARGREIFAHCALSLIALATGVGLAAIQLVPAYELSGLSIRAGGMTYKESVSFSLPPPLALKAFLPVFGDPQPFSEWLGYVGVAALVLAALAIATRWRSPYAVFAIATGLVALFFAFGQYNPLYPLAYKVVPGLSMFRVPARWLFLYTFAAAALAGIGADYLGQHGGAVSQRKRGLVAVGGVAIAALLAVTGAYVSLKGSFPLEMPSTQTRVAWLALGLLALGLVVAGIGLRRGRLAQIAVVLLVAGELFAASQGLELNQANVEEAYTSMRPAVAHFLADRGLYRILPLSENTFDPGDLKEMQEMLAQALPPERIYDYVVAAKLKETLMPNLPLRYRLATLDGYDGGMLPLKRYVELKELFPRQGKAAADARLREELATMPDSKLLGWLNVKYVLMDRTRDAWVDGVYYDLALTQTADAASPGFALRSNIPPFEATSVGIISNLSGSETVANGTEVAWVTAVDVSGETFSAPLRAGVDTSEGRHAQISVGASAPHRQAKKAKAWKGEPDAWDYAAKVMLPKPMILKEVAVRYALAGGELNLRGVSLIDDRTGASYPAVLSNALKLVHVGDVKIYENLDWLPRAFLAYDKVIAEDDTGALAALRDATAVAEGRVVLMAKDLREGAGQTLGSGEAGPVATGRPGGPVEILSYEPEKIVITAQLDRQGWLVLTDSYYPGWRVWVDGVEGRVLRANYQFRGVPLEPGQHSVEFRYEPASLTLGLWISVATAAAAICVFASTGLVSSRLAVPSAAPESTSEPA